MPPRTHSILAPSSKEWFHCGLAAKFLATKEEGETNEMAEFGTECHALEPEVIAWIKDYKAATNREEFRGTLLAAFKYLQEQAEVAS